MQARAPVPLGLNTASCTQPLAWPYSAMHEPNLNFFSAGFRPYAPLAGFRPSTCLR